MKQRTICATAALVLAGPALGHHSDAALDMNTVATFDGTITEYTLRNPHSYFVVETKNEAGETTLWEVQMGSALSVSRRGWTADTLSLGDHVVVGVRLARDGRPYGLLTSLEKDSVPISYERLPPPEVEVSTTTLEGVWIVDRESLSVRGRTRCDTTPSVALRIASVARAPVAHQAAATGAGHARATR